ncbi:MAG: asparagine synthase (glutamine-hydrolyzing) [Isosphaeraceae bacterium]
MCGITGVFTREPEVLGHAGVVAGMTSLMVRRGPDDQGGWSDGRHAFFGFRRLSILDLSPAGHQPMLTADGHAALVFNGEVYNFRELRRDLEREGATFRSSGDTEVVLQALARWGKRALARFNGMFALAYFDVRRRRLLLVRDHLGIKPLYYLTHARGLVFGSQFDQILRHPWCDRSAVDLEVLGLYLRLGYIPAPHGLFRGTHQVKPGHWVELGVDDEPRSGRYYEFDDSESPRLRGLDAVEAVAEAVDAAVRRQTVSDVPVGTFLSGGIDSPLVAGLMGRASTSPVPAFTIGTTDVSLDESEVARRYAQELNLEHTVRVFDDRAALGHLDDLASAYGEPFADSSAFPSLMLSQMTRERVTVALSGDGGDELFWGYPRFAKWIKARFLFRLPRAARLAIYAGARVTGRRWPPQGVKYPTLGDWYLSGQSGLHSPDLEKICPEARGVPDSFQTYQLRGVPDEAGLASWMRKAELECHLPMILLKMDRASMHHGLEVRVPLLDLEVVATAARISHEECLRDGVGKRPLRESLKKLVHEESIPTRKAGFSIPMSAWLRGVLRPRFEQLLLERDPYPNGLFDRAALRRLYDVHLAGGDRHRGLWTLLSLQIWADRHLAPPFSLTESDQGVPRDVAESSKAFTTPESPRIASWS